MWQLGVSQNYWSYSCNIHIESILSGDYVSLYLVSSCNNLFDNQIMKHIIHVD